MHIYLDTDVISGIAKADFEPKENQALRNILDRFEKGEFALVTSKVAKEEIDKCKHDQRKDITKVFEQLEKVQFVEDHLVKAFHNDNHARGGASSPLVEDDPISSKLRDIAIDRTDAHHLMIAIRSRCAFFLTHDGTILKKGKEITAEFGIMVAKPSDFLNSRPLPAPKSDDK